MSLYCSQYSEVIKFLVGLSLIIIDNPATNCCDHIAQEEELPS